MEWPHVTEVDGVVIHSVCVKAGAPPSSPIFVLVHGLGMSHRYMMPTARLLAAAGCVHVPDLPGFGKSDKPKHALSVPQMADVLAQWLNERGIVSPVLIGNSLGAQVIADYAARYSGSLKAAVLIAPTIDPAARRMSLQIFRLLRDIPREPLALYGIGVRDYFIAGYSRILQTLRSALEHPISSTLALIRDPVLLIRGGRDPIIPDSWMHQAAQLIPHSQLVVVPNAAHAVNFNSPEILTAEVLKFVAQIADLHSRNLA